MGARDHGGAGRGALTMVATLVGGLVAAGCGGAQDRVVAIDGLTAWFPAAVEVRDAEEPLRARARIAHAYDEDGARYEIARFETYEPLDDDGARSLMARTVAALTALPGARDHQATPIGEDGRRAEVVVRFRDGTRGRWSLVIVGDRTFWQVSVVGPDAPAVGERVERFFASVRLP